MDEMVEALMDMKPTKAVGVDGFSTMFLKKYWHVVGKEVG